eukprot:483039-Rhodomonas_salina.1
MTSILGDSEYARQLAKDFVTAIHNRYDLKRRYTRGRCASKLPLVIQLSCPNSVLDQPRVRVDPDADERTEPVPARGAEVGADAGCGVAVYLFALIALDENWSRRRMLLQADPTAASGSGAAGAKLEVAVTPRSMLASSFDVPEDKVAVFEVELQLTRTEACASTLELQSRICDTMHDYLSTTASASLTAQITRLSVDMGDEQCGARRALRSLLTEWSSATAEVQLMVVFAKGADAVFHENAFMEMAGVNFITGGANNRAPPPPMLPGCRVTIDDSFKCDDCSPSAAKSSSSDSSDTDNTALIAGVCGEVGGAVLVGAGVMLWLRSKNEEAVMAAPGQSIDVNELKAQLQVEV